MIVVHERSIVAKIQDRLRDQINLVQILTGPRQVGKTTAARSVEKNWPGKAHYAAADLPLPPGPEWIKAQWLTARKLHSEENPALLILDEIQKVRGWSESVKALWEEDRTKNMSMKVLLLGSSALLISRGMTESLSGRFYLHRCLHWSFEECVKTFGFDLEKWIYFGGYPGAAPMTQNEDVWRSYVTDSLIETVLARDVLAMQNITKPTLLRHLFALSSSVPAQILSYNKMLGQLTDAGNTTTLAHYLRLLETAFLVSGLERFSGNRIRKRGSSPKLIFWNNALVSALGMASFDQARKDSAWWGRLVENAVGAHLLNHLQGLRYQVCYWRKGNLEVDFVIRTPGDLFALEVKSGRPARPRGLGAFMKLFPKAKPLIVGTGGMDLIEFFKTDPATLFS